MARFHTTVTERGSFRSCRRQWYLEVVERLAHKDRVPWHFIFGDAIHSALEIYYKDNKRNLSSALRRFKREWVKQMDLLMDEYGGLWSNLEPEWAEYLEKGQAMLNYYNIYDRQAEFDWDKVLAVNIEQRAFVPLLDLAGSPLAGNPLLSGKLDLVVERKDGVWIIDHKTAATAYDARALDVDDQLTGYCYIWWRISGEVPRGAIYNALIKDPPRPPRELKSGGLSTDKAQRTTYDLYMQAITERDQDPDDYEEILEYLKEKGWNQFFIRDGLQRNVEELLSFEERLYYEYLDMERCIEHPEWAYPNPSQRTCPGCGMLPLCQAMEEKNPDWVRENMYEVIPPRTTIPKGA